MKVTEETKKEALHTLYEMLKPEQTIYTIITEFKASSNGVTRKIAIIAVIEGEAVNLSHLVAQALELKYKDGSLYYNGIGSDAGFDIVYNLSYSLYGNGYKLKQRWL